MSQFHLFQTAVYKHFKEMSEELQNYLRHLKILKG